MCDIKCPFCNLDIRTHRLFVNGCDNTHSPLWQELMSTRKALDVAVDALKNVKRYLCEMPAPDGATATRMACESATTVKKALEQITALEQKDK